MCDIYTVKCKKCGKLMEMHLDGHQTEHNEIEVFCWEHIPNENIRIYECKRPNIMGCRKTWLMFPTKVTFLVGVRNLTENAIKHKEGNHPNLHVCELKEEKL